MVDTTIRRIVLFLFFSLGLTDDEGDVDPPAGSNSASPSDKVTLTTHVSEESFLFLGAGNNDQMDQDT